MPLSALALDLSFSGFQFGPLLFQSTLQCRGVELNDDVPAFTCVPVCTSLMICKSPEPEAAVSTFELRALISPRILR